MHMYRCSWFKFKVAKCDVIHKTFWYCIKPTVNYYIIEVLLGR